MEPPGGLPAGATVDEVALARVDGLVDFRVEPHRVVLTTRAFRAGEVIEVPLTVRPAFVGSFQTAPLRLSRADRPWEAPVDLAPVTWTVRPSAAAGG